MELFQCFKCKNRFSEPVLKISHDLLWTQLFIQCPVCGGVMDVQEKHRHTTKTMYELTDQEQDVAVSSWHLQDIAPPDINTVLKYLYG